MGSGSVLALSDLTVDKTSAGVWVYGGAPTLTRLTLSHADNDGFVTMDPGSATLVACRLFANERGIGFFSHGSLVLDRTLVEDNAVGQGLLAYSPASVTVVNSIFTNNVGGLAIENTVSGGVTTVSIVNSTIHQNNGQGFQFYGGSGGTVMAQIKNSVITGNGAAGIKQLGASSVTTTYSDVWNNAPNYDGAIAGPGSISQNPLYVNASTDLRLQAASVCIDAGTATGAPSSDLLGVARPLDGDGFNGAAFDMGAYEYVPSSACGNGSVDAGEACDSGALNGAYGNCKADCSGPGAHCGDGIPNGPEACDDGNQIDTDGCLTTCVLAKCGDGVVQAGVEDCDDGNVIDDDACPSDCKAKVSTCGNGIKDRDEACDDGNVSNVDECLTTCKFASCGDGFLRAGVEACDDGNGIAGDGCSPQCMDEHAGAGGAGGRGSGMVTTTTGTGEAAGGSSGGASDEAGGCGCRTAGGSEGPSPSWLLVAAALVVARRRRGGIRRFECGIDLDRLTLLST